MPTGSSSSTGSCAPRVRTRPTPFPSRWCRLRRESRLRQELLDGGWLDYAGVAELRGVSVNAARFAVHKAAERRTLLLVQHEGAVLVPRFQLDADR